MRWISLVIIGLGGLAVLLSLGTWQVKRLDWKTDMLAEIEAAIDAPATELPDNPYPAQKYLPVEARGTISGEPLRVLISTVELGPAYRLIAPFDTGTRRVMVDLGAAPVAAEIALPTTPLTVTGNLHWPDEVDGYTPEPDLSENIWFARDVPAMAQALETEPTLIVARSLAPGIEGLTPLPVSTAGIPNDHLQYAITWFSIAVLWAGMTALLAWRMAKRTI
ncbi:SURF1 family protein [Palleronia caenipelagi]|uniref:SURF1-like protein n=1 Tax=Palleronia caenipelagi TaxID=2489174 RepID=A0A547Q7U5_9RHOB|nr:SURF1 family protein [Palleronia caenipelagi]TRD22467.1 SURF1 family protein [Palleronia caenipelagi]